MIDETNIYSYFTEPIGYVRFLSSELLKAHVLKHVLSQSKNEKWRLLNGIDTPTIHAAQNGDPEAFQRLASTYERYLSDTLVHCCEKGVDHLHFLYIYPEQTVSLLGCESREPVQVVKCFPFSEKIVIIAASHVRKDRFLPYKIKTGYQVYHKIGKKAWQKVHTNRQSDQKAMYRGKKIHLIADHSENYEE